MVPGGNGYWIFLHGDVLDGEAWMEVRDELNEGASDEGTVDDGDRDKTKVPVTVLLRVVVEAVIERFVQPAVMDGDGGP